MAALVRRTSLRFGDGEGDTDEPDAVIMEDAMTCPCCSRELGRLVVGAETRPRLSKNGPRITVRQGKVSSIGVQSVGIVPLITGCNQIMTFVQKQWVLYEI